MRWLRALLKRLFRYSDAATSPNEGYSQILRDAQRDVDAVLKSYRALR